MPGGFPEPLRQADRTHVLWRGRKLIYFGGCDYLRLSFHPKILRAVRDGVKRYGLNVAASRRTTGNHELYQELEHATENFFGAERAIFVGSGYLANLCAAQGLRGTIDHVFVDERAHASLRDAVPFLECSETVFAHRDPDDLRDKLRAHSHERIAVLTDGMFAHDGSIARLPAYRKVAGPNALLWVDDAHAAGILGENGRGSPEWFGLSRRNLIQTITFSKAFGVSGGAILCDRSRVERIVSRSAALAGGTPAPLPLAAAVIEALRIARAESFRRKNLWDNVELFWQELELIPGDFSPIIPAKSHNPPRAKQRLRKAGIFPSFIEYGGTEKYFRFAISSEHTAAQIKELARVIAASPGLKSEKRR